MVHEINSIPRAIVNPQFVNTITNAFCIAWVSLLHTGDSHIYQSFCPPVSQCNKPFFKDLSYLYLYHILIVSQKIQKSSQLFISRLRRLIFRHWYEVKVRPSSSIREFITRDSSSAVSIRFGLLDEKKQLLRAQTIATMLNQNRHLLNTSLLPATKALETINNFITAILNYNANRHIPKIRCFYAGAARAKPRAKPRPDSANIIDWQEDEIDPEAF